MSETQTNLLSVIIPVYNEERTIERILDRILAVEMEYGYKLEIILVNDFSGDRSADVITTYIRNHPEADMKLLNSL
jgi:glycosyltransferase involved in cell wall biosynthesis